MISQRCQEILKELKEFAAQKKFEFEMQIAKELFFIYTGKINDDEPFFEKRLELFLEFFIFDYRLESVACGETVYEFFLKQSQGQITVNQSYEYEQFRSCRYSVFLLEKFSEKKLWVLDLLSKRRFVVNPLKDYSFEGFEGTNIFEGRLFHYHNQHYFTGNFIIHPSDVSTLIRKALDLFIEKPMYCKAEKEISWQQEMALRKKLLVSIHKRRQAIDSASKAKSIDHLNLTKKIAEVPRSTFLNSLTIFLNPELNKNVSFSVFAPESKLYDPFLFICNFSYCELQTHRYKHLGNKKVYSLIRTSLQKLFHGESDF